MHEHHERARGWRDRNGVGHDLRRVARVEIEADTRGKQRADEFCAVPPPPIPIIDQGTHPHIIVSPSIP